MGFLLGLASILAGYLLGSLPSGLIVVRLTTGRDIRSVGSGRTGGTNAMRAGGSLAGLITGVLDTLKGFAAVWIARLILPGQFGWEAVAGLAAVIGHNYSLYLVEWVETGFGKRPVFRGGAGGAPTMGVAAAFWFPSLLFVLPVGALIFFVVGYASVTTIVGGLLVALIFLVRATLGLSSYWYFAFGVAATALLVWALRPNIERLAKGTERLVGLRAWWREHHPPKTEPDLAR